MEHKRRDTTAEGITSENEKKRREKKIFGNFVFFSHGMAQQRWRPQGGLGACGRAPQKKAEGGWGVGGGRGMKGEGGNPKEPNQRKKRPKKTEIRLVIRSHHRHPLKCTRFLPSCYWVLSSFIGFYRVFLGFTW